MVESISEPNESSQGLSCKTKPITRLQAALDQQPFPKAGETWYLTSAKWWRTHVIHAVSTNLVDNTDIINPDTKRLKPDLIEGPFNDYVVVNPELWQQIKSRFETPSGSEIARRVIKESDGSTRVEVYPFEFQVRLFQMNGLENTEIWKHITFSCKDKMSTIRAHVLNVFGIPEKSDLRWWRRPQQSLDSDSFQLVEHEVVGDDGEMLPDPTLDQINVATGDYIIVQRKDPSGTFPNELPPLSFSGTNKLYEGQTVSSYMLDKWHDGLITEINFREQKILVQPIGLPDNFARYYAFNSNDIKEKEELSDTKPKPSSSDSSSSSGSVTRCKRVLEGDLRTGANGSVPVASRLRLGRGIKGLQNLGNTCFMASTLQCLNRTLLFTEYFITKEYERDLNFSNPLGMKGQLAKEYAKLLHEIWFEPPDRPSGGSSSIAPFGIKKVIATHAPRFSGFRQHDSQELLAFLLDGLHEDVNRVTNKPYTSAIESDGRDDDVVAEESWNTHLARNRSVVVDLFQGQLKSSVVCPKCQRISVTFDPMMYLSLPLAPLDMCSFSVTVVYADLSRKPMLQSFEVSKLGNIADMLSVIGQRTGIRADHLLICEIYANDVHKVFSLSEKISSISPSDTIFVYELESSIASLGNSTLQWVKHAHVSTPSSTMVPISSSAFFAYPRPIFNPRELLCLSALHAFVLKIASSICTSDSAGLSADDIIVKLIPKAPGLHYSQQVITGDDNSDWNFPSSIPFDIIVHWSAHAHATKFDTTQNFMMRSTTWRRQNSPAVTLQDCIELFTTEEILRKEESWYCSSCKEHQQATKKFDLWKLPKILIVHLKRFQYTSFSRSKLDNYVDYPIEGLDLTQFVKGLQRDSPVIYDLYAVSNHYGGFGGGHYTAYGKVSQNQWYSFDDSSTHPISVDQIKTRAAYVLFYQLRESTDISG